MYAIVEYKGFQFKVEPDQLVKIPYLSDMKEGSELKIENVLILHDSKTLIGKPYVKNASVIAEVTDHGRDKKIIVFKKKRRKGYQKKQGHRQNFTEIKIKEIKH
jgi:large subunit ribosomal protein L21